MCLAGERFRARILPGISQIFDTMKTQSKSLSSMALDIAIGIAVHSMSGTGIIGLPVPKTQLFFVPRRFLRYLGHGNLEVYAAIQASFFFS